MKANEKQIQMRLEEIYWDLIKQQIESAASQIKLKNMKNAENYLFLYFATSESRKGFPCPLSML